MAKRQLYLTGKAGMAFKKWELENNCPNYTNKFAARVHMDNWFYMLPEDTRFGRYLQYFFHIEIGAKVLDKVLSECIKNEGDYPAAMRAAFFHAADNWL